MSVPDQLPLEWTFGPLILRFTCKFSWIYNDQKTGSNKDGAFWRPDTEGHNGFRPLGDYAYWNYDDINNKSIALLVASNDPTALRHPDKFVEVWNDHGSGGSHDGSIWRPVPPNGYVALGFVASNNYNAPSADVMWCVRKDLVAIGNATEEVWEDKGSGAGKNVSIWRAKFAPGQLPLDNLFLLAAGTFVAWDRYGTAPGYSDIPGGIWCLQLPQSVFTEPDPKNPTLVDADHKPEPITAVPIKTVIVPCTALQDVNAKPDFMAKVSPFYKVIRLVTWDCREWVRNSTDKDVVDTITIRQGITQKEEETFHTETGVKISTEAGFSIEGVAEVKTSMELSVTLGFSKMSSYEWVTERTSSKQYTLAAWATTARWVGQTSVVVKRGTGEQVGNVSFVPDASLGIVDMKTIPH